eukprot:TRINITY_DN56893_c0_g1_i1.p1 TRINITY_DN56893_c0_g1~~TRINITY_DN56893_c0_g1_i1.p1  ORF type:complete len:856 (+),score=125.32 TRINITY_DN56893_c0_g1_i1:49-2616(+)
MVFMRPQLLLTALVLTVRNVADAQSQSRITADDLTTAEQAKAKKTTFCDGVKEMDLGDKDNRKKRLEVASGNRFLEAAIREASNEDEVATKIQEKASDFQYTSVVAGPLVMCFLSIFIYCFCCWTACCKCCRCCRKSRNPGPFTKLVFAFLVAGLMCGLGVAAILARAGLADAKDGYNLMTCAMADFAHVTLSGQTTPPFLGLLPAIQELENLESTLDANSDFITQLRGIIDSTAVISESVLLASTTFTMLADMMNDDANVLPKESTSTSLQHKCEACQPIGRLLSSASAALDSGVGSALANAREEVKKQLDGPALTDLRSSMSSAMSPIDGFKESLMNLFEPFIKSSTGENAGKNIDSMGLPAVASIIVLAILIVMCACCTATCWLLCDRKRRNEGAYIHRCACTTWCCGCWYIWLVFFFGGIMAILCVPLAGTCLIMDDLDSNFLRDMDTTFKLNMSGSGDMIFNIVDECFSNPDPNANPELLRLINITDNGTSVTMHHKIVVSTKDQINSAFNRITSASAGSGSTGQSMSTDSNIQRLRTTIADLQTDAMLLPDSSVATDSNYAAMSSNAGLRDYLASSGACDDYTPTSSDLVSAMPSGTPMPVKGIRSFATQLGSMGTGYTPIGWSGFCGQKVTCSLVASPSDQSACAAGNSFMDLKYRLRTVNTFKCRRFVDSTGRACDILPSGGNTGMVRSSSGTYSGDCVRSDRTWKVETYACTLSDFTTLVNQFNQIINLVTQRIDDTTTDTMTQISQDMKTLVNTKILDKIDTVAAGVTCGFMGSMWQRIIDGFCYGGVNGFVSIVAAYNACAALTLILVILIYIVWRITFDNYQFRSGQNGDRPSLLFNVPIAKE